MVVGGCRCLRRRGDGLKRTISYLHNHGGLVALTYDRGLLLQLADRVGSLGALCRSRRRECSGFDGPGPAVRRLIGDQLCSLKTCRKVLLLGCEARSHTLAGECLRLGVVHLLGIVLRDSQPQASSCRVTGFATYRHPLLLLHAPLHHLLHRFPAPNRFNGSTSRWLHAPRRRIPLSMHKHKGSSLTKYHLLRGRASAACADRPSH